LPPDAAPEWFVWHDGRFQSAVEHKLSLGEPSPLGIPMGQYIAGSRLKEVYASNPHGYLDADNSVEYTINSHGMRGPEVPTDKPANTFRILGLGDSFTFGIGVRDDHTCLRRLEADLNAEYRGQPTFQVLNGSVQGYNTPDEVASLEHRWLAMSPDLVVIFFYLNDAYNDLAIKNRGEELGVNQPQPWLGKVSRIYDLGQHAWHAAAARRTVEALYVEPYFTKADRVLGQVESKYIAWQNSRQALAHAAKLSRERGFKLALVVWPDFYKLDGNYPFEAVHRLLMQTGADLGIPTLDLLETDHHPNDKAHAIAAEAVAKFLRREKMLPGVGANDAAANRSPSAKYFREDASAAYVDQRCEKEDLNDQGQFPHDRVSQAIFLPVVVDFRFACLRALVFPPCGGDL
jgi:lysophospholipase L1-like esterase